MVCLVYFSEHEIALFQTYQSSAISIFILNLCQCFIIDILTSIFTNDPLITCYSLPLSDFWLS